MTPGSQTERLFRWLRANPGASSLEITQALSIVNVTGRISDLRAAGHVVLCKSDGRGVRRYWLAEPARTALWSESELREAWGK